MLELAGGSRRGGKVDLDLSLSMGAAAAFKGYVDKSFPVGAERARSAIIHQVYADRIIRLMKGESNETDKNFHHSVKKSKFQLLNLPEAGLRDVQCKIKLNLI